MRGRSSGGIRPPKAWLSLLSLLTYTVLYTRCHLVEREREGGSLAMRGGRVAAEGLLRLSFPFYPF